MNLIVWFLLLPGGWLAAIPVILACSYLLWAWREYSRTPIRVVRPNVVRFAKRER